MRDRILSLASLNAYAFDRFTDAVPLAQKAMEFDSGSPTHALPERVPGALRAKRAECPAVVLSRGY
jgi:hypothetical protein